MKDLFLGQGVAHTIMLLAFVIVDGKAAFCVKLVF